MKHLFFHYLGDLYNVVSFPAPEATMLPVVFFVFFLGGDGLLFAVALQP